MLLLSDPITKIPLIKDKQAQKLSRLKIETVKDLLWHFPFRYEDFSKVQNINSIFVDQEIVIKGRIVKPAPIYSKAGRFMVLATLENEAGNLSCVWFNQPYLLMSLRKEKETEFLLKGKVGFFGKKIALISPQIEKVSEQGIEPFQPIYPETEAVSSKWLRARIRKTLELLDPNELTKTEGLPAQVLLHHQLLPQDVALPMIHFPKTPLEIKQSRHRFAFEEMFNLQLKAIESKKEWQKKKATFTISLSQIALVTKKFNTSLPFVLTNAQNRAIGEIMTDLQKNVPMNRLLQGDVGSGKTVVAAEAIYAAFLSGHQAAFLAPTEVLADQHYNTLTNLLQPLGMNIALFTASNKPLDEDQRSKIKDQKHRSKIKNSETATDHPLPNTSYDLFIGTHALFFEKAKFENLGIIVVDEQHRFGVEQRVKLLEKAPKGKTPHVLNMSATPIPRSIALTIYGNYDLSLIDEMPVGRKPVKTWVVPPEKRTAAYKWIEEQIVASRSHESKRSHLLRKAAAQAAVQPRLAGPGVTSPEMIQALVVCPLIEESQIGTMAEVKAATSEFEKLRKFFTHLNLGLIHGRLKSKEKTAVMEKVKSGEIDILVATPVVEVGLDLPNATIILIEAADRFGLASLHQLRGRVGRRGQQAYCLIFSESKSSDVLRRLKAMETIHDGLKLAELDLAMRGPGEFSGSEQHGFIDLKIAKLTDLELIKETKEAAEESLKVIS